LCANCHRIHHYEEQKNPAFWAGFLQGKFY
jgi:hypothetical protein